MPYEGSVRIPLIVRWPESMDASITVPRGSVLTRFPTELRDLFPTFLDVAGGWQSGLEDTLDGRPLTWLLRNEDISWRPWIDMEHNWYHSPSWSALTDGEIKYVYWALSGNEQLFDLTVDPQETRDLAPDPAQEGLLELWRERLAGHFEREERGAGWVWNGVLQRRPLPCLYSCHHPGWPVLKVICVVVSAVPFPVLATLGSAWVLLQICVGIFIWRHWVKHRRRKRAQNQEIETSEPSDGDPGNLIDSSSSPASAVGTAQEEDEEEEEDGEQQKRQLVGNQEQQLGGSSTSASDCEAAVATSRCSTLGSEEAVTV